MAEKLAALIVCPGRGTYGKAELGYLKRHHKDKADLIATVDRLRADRGREPISALDGAEKYKSRHPHTRRHRLAAHLHRFFCRFPRHRPRPLRRRGGDRQFDGLVHRSGLRRSGRSRARLLDRRRDGRQQPGRRAGRPGPDSDRRRAVARSAGTARRFARFGRDDRRPTRLRALRLDPLGRDDRLRRQRGRPRRLARRGPGDARTRAYAAGQSRPVPQRADARLVRAGDGEPARRTGSAARPCR